MCGGNDGNDGGTANNKRNAMEDGLSVGVGAEERGSTLQPQIAKWPIVVGGFIFHSHNQAWARTHTPLQWQGRWTVCLRCMYTRLSWSTTKLHM